MIRNHFGRILATSALVATLAGTGMAQDTRFDLNNMSSAERDAFGTAVRDYLLENPQVIMEAVAVLEERERAQASMADRTLVQSNLDQIVDDGFSWVGGNPDGDITMVEFMDYRCGYCRRAKGEVDALLAEDGNIRFVVKEFPVLGEPSVLAARFAVATKIVEGDDAYGNVHDALMSLNGEPSEPVLRRLARTLGLDAGAIMDEMNSAEVTRRLNETRQLAQKLEITGTPGFVIGSQMLRGAAPMQTMMAAVIQERQAD